MKIVVAPDKFKGSLSAIAAAEAIARGLRSVWPDAELLLAPIADGGEGFAQTLCTVLNGQWVETAARDPLGREVSARYVWIEEQELAVIDMSEASGLWRLTEEERAPLRATTYGTGQLIRHAAERGARTILVGLGGSATTDGGIGMAEALGFEFLTSDGEPLEALPANLLALTRIQSRRAISLPTVIAACDVQNPLLGPRGAARVFGPQKGADEITIKTLELALGNLADVVQQEFDVDFRDAAGAGAAGGIGFGLLSFCSATIRSGFEVVAEALRLEGHIATSDLVLTGEGQIDGQTMEGKGPAGVAALARHHGKPVVAFAGSVAGGAGVPTPFSATCSIVDEPVTLEEAMRRAPEFLERTANRTARLVQLGRSL